MSITIHAMTCGWLTMSLGSMLQGEQGQIKVPVPAYLITHPKGTALFDTGLHPSMQTDAAARLGPLAPMFKVDYQAGEDVVSRLASLNITVDDIDFIINSHLHFDHCGANDCFPNSRVVVQKKEWQAAGNDDIAARNGFFRQDWDHGHDAMLAEGELDLFKDGSVVCIPTPGHTPGHQSLRVKLESGDVVLTGDACYLKKTLTDMHLPAILHNAEQMKSSLEKLRSLQRRGARIFYGHDPDFWAGIPQAPLPVV